MKKFTKIYMCIFFFFFIFLFLSKNVNAIGISPASLMIDFQPGVKKTFKYMVINKENREIFVKIYKRGDMAENIILNQTEAVIPANSNKIFSFDIIMPEKPERYGNYDTRIGVIEIPKVVGERIEIGAVAAVEMLLLVKIPYPPKYIEARLYVNDTKKGDFANITLSIINLGELDVLAKGNITIYDNEKIITYFDLQSVIKTGKTKNFFFEFETENFGKHLAVANIVYDGKFARTEKNFRVGDIFVNITSIKLGKNNKIKKNTVAKIEIEIESFWNEKIDNVYVEISVLDEKENKIKTIRSSTEIKAFEKETIFAYLDTKNMKTGNYNVKTVLYYQDRTTEKTIEMEIVEFLIFVIIIFIFLIIVPITIFLYLKKKTKKR